MAIDNKGFCVPPFALNIINCASGMFIDKDTKTCVDLDPEKSNFG